MSGAALHQPSPIERATVRKAGLRLVWFLILLYLLNNIDRTNVGFATLTMSRALGLTAQTFGTAVGVFYVGYLLCEIPSNLAFARFGARRSLARMAVASGCVTMLTAFVQGAGGFYALRFLLGVAEAGYLPGIVLFLSFWFPKAYRARINALFMLSLPFGFTVSSALAGSILSLDGTLGMAGWQWLFLLEGAPAVLIGCVSLFYLTDYPKDASWLSAEQRRWLGDTLAAEAQDVVVRRPGFWNIATSRVVLTCAAIYWALNFGLVTLTTWTPTVIKTFGLSNHEVGLVSMVAPLLGAGAMLLWSRASDRSGERVVNTSLALLVGAAGWTLAALAASPALVVAGFVMAAAGVYSTYALSFSISQTYIARSDRAVAIATIGVLGNLGGVLTPIIVGRTHDLTHSFTTGFLVTAAMMALGSGIAFTLRSHLGRAEPAPLLRLRAIED